MPWGGLYDVPPDSRRGMGISAFACTPDHFPGLMAAAMRGGSVAAWAAAQGTVTKGGAAG
ncbi:hypothetical protein DESA109040_20995 [Deinococcus saxicola]|uniref:hypothetical protein n=1 Tax=Deinococcus saxicola TaxID=249406 RepID=UPI0039F0E09A